MALLWRHCWLLVQCVFLSSTHLALSQKRQCIFQVKPLNIHFHRYGYVNGSVQYCDFTDCCVGYYRIKNESELEVEYLGCYLTEKACSDSSCLGTPIDRNYFRCICNTDFCNDNITWTPEQPLRLTYSYDIYIYVGILVICSILALVVFCVAVATLNLFRKETKERLNSLHDPLCAKASDIDVQLQRIVCEGIVTVWEGRYQGTCVAVKVFPMAWKHKFIAEREVYQLPLMVQAGIVQLLGSGSIGTKEVLVLQYAKYGSLHSYLSTHTSSWASSLTLCQSLSQGLSYLHSDLHKDGVHKPAVAHRDLSSSNVLVKADGTCALCDFGCSTILCSGPNSCHFYSRKLEGESPMGTLRYMSPEILQGSVCLNSNWCLQADIYSLGLVLWEIWMRCSDLFGERVPLHLLPYEYELGSNVSLENLLQYVIYMDQRPKIPEVWEQHPQGEAIQKLLNECWDYDADARLSVSCVVNRLVSF